jgi:quinol monooxygenase YgiN
MEENERSLAAQKYMKHMREARNDLEKLLKKFSVREEDVPYAGRKFHCDGCQKDIEGRFVMFQVFRDMHQHHNDIVGEVFHVYHPECWNKKVQK